VKFQVIPVPGVPFRATLGNRFDFLKERLLSERLEELEDSESNSRIRQAANEAATLVLGTPYPLLLFPAVFEEKVQAVEAAERKVLFEVTCI
jgi:hypothetical protein